MSLALAHKRRTIALGGAAITAAAVSAALPYSPAEALSSPANARKHLLLQEAALDQDLARISAINGLAGRQALKREELLPKYQEYVQRYCESGLVFPNRVAVQVLVWLFDTAQFEDALELARVIAAMPALAAEQIKEVILAGMDAPLEAGLALERKANALLFASLDQKEGMQAFIEKRPARFTGD